jgi:hypothetical protein
VVPDHSDKDSYTGILKQSPILAGLVLEAVKQIDCWPSAFTVTT